jgi:hypothetical protein
VSPSPTPTTRSIAALLTQVGGAIAGGALLAAAGYLGVSLLFMGADFGMGLLGLQVYAIVLGFGIGAGLGAALASRLVGRHGQPWLAVLGSLSGGVLVAAVTRYGPVRMDLDASIPVVAAVLAVIGAVVGNNLRLRR